MDQVLESEFPSAISWSALIERTGRSLQGHGFTPANTLFGNVICRDEVNRRNIDSFSAYWGDNFELAGLGGYPSGGLTAFQAYRSHVPQGGYLLVLFGPHFGLSAQGEWATVERKGRLGPTIACGSVLGFLEKLEADPHYTPAYSPIDAEQYLVENALLEKRDEFLNRPQPERSVTEAMYSVIHDRVEQILETIGFDRQVALLGGMILNTPSADTDYFVPRQAEIINFGDEPGERISWLNDLT